MKHNYQHILIKAGTRKTNNKSVVRYFIFATKEQNPAFNNVYINNKFLIENFVTYLHEKLKQDELFYKLVTSVALSTTKEKIKLNLTDNLIKDIGDLHTRIKLTKRQKEISEALGISKRTVEHHFESLTKRFCCNNKFHVIYYLIKYELIDIN